MPYRFAFLGRASSWYFRDLRRAAPAQLSLDSIDFNDLTAEVAVDRDLSTIEPDRWPCPLERFDVVLVRTMPPARLEPVIFRMNRLAAAVEQGVSVINSPRSIEIAVDKYLTTLKLEQSGLTVPPTMVCQTADSAMAAFEVLGGDTVIKPLFGGEGRGLARVSDPDMAFRAFRLLETQGDVIYLQQFVEHEGSDLRVLCIGDRQYGMMRSNSLDWRTNVSRGATTEPADVSDEESEFAHRACRAVGAEIAGVDLLRGRDGTLYVLEVNAVPGWRRLAKTLDVDIAREVIDFALRKRSE